MDDSSAFRRRLQIYSVGWLQVVALKTVRSSLSSMVPIIVATSGLKAAEEAMLLSAFFPGYALSQALLGGVVQVYGSKLVLRDQVERAHGLPVTSRMVVLWPRVSISKA